eukprot:TRINITY_DN123047_c0_g1_i1.p1 TRINITY_DN123047_c0_g1~~TRINITY_DN123047_c0_g1_i1.p1  ORF type:complete len:491 (-),score=128.92 TRINITY_DN123047_c0_g1_i1:138-1610(-)
MKASKPVVDGMSIKAQSPKKAFFSDANDLRHHTLPEENEEEEEPEREPQKVSFDTKPKGTVAFTVKNTFIDVGGSVGPAGSSLRNRQVSAPAGHMGIGRQLSELSMAPDYTRIITEEEDYGLDDDDEEEDVDGGLLKDNGLAALSPLGAAASKEFARAGTEDLTFELSALAESQYGMGTVSGPVMAWLPAPYGNTGGLQMAQLAQAGLAAAAEPGSASAAPPPEWVGVQTVMMRNIPNKYTQAMLSDEIGQNNFGGTFDFLYLPIDPETNANKGYAFINFVDPRHAWLFCLAFEGRKMGRFNSSKHVSVRPAVLQGFDANYAHYSNARVNRGDPAARPLFLRQPARVPGSEQATRRRRSGRASAIDIAERQKYWQKQQEDQQRMFMGAYPPSNGLLMPGIGGGAGAMPTAWMPPARLDNAPGPWDGSDEVAALLAAGAAKGAGKGAGASGKASGGAAAPKKINRRFCPFCGSEAGANYKFCENCGKSLQF